MGEATRLQHRDNLRLVLFAFGSAYALYCSLFLTAATYRTRFETVSVARSLALHGTFANPYQVLDTGPTAHLPPLYPAFLSIFFRLFQDQIAYNYFLVSLITAALFGLLVASLPAFAEKVFGSRFAAVFGGSAIVTLPAVMILPGWEMVPVCLCFMAFCLVSLEPVEKPWLLGLLAATVALLHVPAVLFIATWSCGLVLTRRLRPQTLCLASLLAYSLCLPWMLRNLRAVGSFCIRDNFGLELQVSNNDLAQPLISDNFRTAHPLYHPNISLPEALQVKQFGEGEYNRRKVQQAQRWIKANPWKFANLTAQHLLFFWFPDMRVGFSPAVWLLTLLSIPASIAALRTFNKESLLLLSVIAYSLPYALVQSDLRYRTPVVWVTALFAGRTLELVIAKLRAHPVELARASQQPSGSLLDLGAQPDLDAV